MGASEQSVADLDESTKPAAGPGPVDGAEIEMATGLSLDDINALKSDGGEEVRASIAAKFAVQYDRLNHGKSRKLTDDILQLFSRDRSKKVRLRFAEEIKSSRHLPPAVAALLAHDDLEIAAHLLEASPVLSDMELQGIIQKMPEPYALAIAGRKPLNAAVVELLIEHKGTTRVVSRLVENGEADLSEATLDWIFDWGQANPMISECLKRRPNLPFEVTQKHVTALGQQLKWNAITQKAMTKGEAAQLLGQICGSARHQLPRDSKRLNQLLHNLKRRHDAGTLTPCDIIGFLRDRNIDLVEFSLVVAAKLDLRRIRNLLYGGDKRGLTALCLRAGFTTSEYLAFRMALGLVELATTVNEETVTYNPVTAEFAKAQFEEMRGRPEQINAWLEGHHGYSNSDGLSMAKSSAMPG